MNDIVQKIKNLMCLVEITDNEKIKQKALDEIKKLEQKLGANSTVN